MFYYDVGFGGGEMSVESSRCASDIIMIIFVVLVVLILMKETNV